MSANPLLVIGPPWIMLADLDSAPFGRLVDELCAGGGENIEIDGARATTSATLFEEFAQAARLPGYFGRNWAALDECLADLEWLPGSSYVVTLRNPGRLLESAPRERPLFVKVITKVALEWAEPVNDGEEWDRPSVPFHLVAHYADFDARGDADRSSSDAIAWLGDDIASI
jgi:hypothetical protein